MFDNLFSASNLQLAAGNNNDFDIQLKDPGLKIEKIVGGLDWPTSMAFLGRDDILVLEKNTGKVLRIINGKLLDEPVLDVNVATALGRGMLGIAIADDQQHNNRKYVFLYFTEASTRDGDDMDRGIKPLGNRLYRYELLDTKLVNPKLLFDISHVNTSMHNGGKVIIGPDNNIYFVIGDIQGKGDFQSVNTKAQNYQNGTEPDGRSGILRIILNGTLADKGILGDYYPLNLYYGYGIRNSFGIDFDPVTGILWDTENGGAYGDEINLVEPGFNSGWLSVQGIWKPDYSNKTKYGFTIDNINLDPNREDLVDFNGKGNYSSPEFTWKNTIAPTAIKFFHSDKLGPQYQDDIFVGDVKNGYLYHFDLNYNRDGLLLKGALADKIANNSQEFERSGVIFGKGFGGITDLQVGPDGYLYILSVWRGEIYKVIPEIDTKDAQKSNYINSAIIKRSKS